MKYTRSDIASHSELVSNCISSCHTIEQLKIAEEMITIFISQRFNNVINAIELSMYEDYLYSAIGVQKEMIEKRGNLILEYPTFERNMN